MSEESPITNPELYEAIDSEIEGKAVEVVRKSRRRRKKDEDEMPLPLDKLSGREVIQILDFLHKRYLSWMTEAESAKYATVYKSAKEEALKESLEMYAEIQKQNQQLIEQLNKLIERLQQQQQVQPQQIAKETVQEMKKSLLDDPRVRSLLFVLLESFLGKNETYQKFRPFLARILIPEAFRQQEETTTHEEQQAQNEGPQNEGQG